MGGRMAGVKFKLKITLWAEIWASFSIIEQIQMWPVFPSRVIYLDLLCGTFCHIDLHTPRLRSRVWLSAWIGVFGPQLPWGTSRDHYNTVRDTFTTEESIGWREPQGQLNPRSWAAFLPSISYFESVYIATYMYLSPGRLHLGISNYWLHLQQYCNRAAVTQTRREARAEDPCWNFCFPFGNWKGCTRTYPWRPECDHLVAACSSS